MDTRENTWLLTSTCIQTLQTCSWCPGSFLKKATSLSPLVQKPAGCKYAWEQLWTIASSPSPNASMTSALSASSCSTPDKSGSQCAVQLWAQCKCGHGLAGSHQKIELCAICNFKNLLEGEGASFGQGGRHRTMLAPGIQSRLSTKVAIQIVCAHARILCLPPTSQLQSALLGARAVTGRTWLDYALLVARALGIHEEYDFTQWPGVFFSFNQGTRDEAVRLWKRNIVEPAARHRPSFCGVCPKRHHRKCLE